MAALIVLIVIGAVVLITIAQSVRIVPQARAGIVERLGRYHRTLDAGLALVVPYVDRVKPLIDMRETVVSFQPQPVITEDNLTIQIDTVIYFQVTDPKAATYEIAEYLAAIEQLTVTTLRNVCGGMNLEETLTSRDKVSTALRVVLDEATGKWGIRVNRVELKAVDPPPSIQEAMEKQMRAERDRRAAILTAEGVKQSQILTAEGEKQSSILRAEGQRESQILSAEGQSKAIETVFDAIHRGDADPKLLAYQYLQMLPQIAQGDANKVWIIPSEFTQALGNLGSVVDSLPKQGGTPRSGPATPSPRRANGRSHGGTPRHCDARSGSSTSRTSTCGLRTSRGCSRTRCAAARGCTSWSSCRVTPMWTDGSRCRPTRSAGSRRSTCAARRLPTGCTCSTSRTTRAHPCTSTPRSR